VCRESSRFSKKVGPPRRELKKGRRQGVLPKRAKQGRRKKIRGEKIRPNGTENELRQHWAMFGTGTKEGRKKDPGHTQKKPVLTKSARIAEKEREPEGRKIGKNEEELIKPSGDL